MSIRTPNTDWGVPLRYFDEARESRRTRSRLQQRSHSQGPRFSWEHQRYPRHVYDGLKTPGSFRLLCPFAYNLQTCQIFAVFHQLNPDEGWVPYEALSYTWGPAVYGDSNKCIHNWEILICKTKAIRNLGPRDEADNLYGSSELDTSDISSIAVTSNLSDFLRAFAEQLNRPIQISLWIDALCIDQSNEAEKKAQISIMGNIYANANTVKAWVGMDSSNFDTFIWMNEVVAPQLIESKPEYQSIPEWVKWLGQFDPVKPTFWEEKLWSVRPKEANWKACWQAYWKFLTQRQWFKRAWTLQEAILAKRIEIICGQDCKKMEWTKLVNLAWILYRTTWGNQLFSTFYQDNNNIDPPITIVGISNEHQQLLYFDREKRVSPAPDARAKGDGTRLDEWFEFWSRILTTIRERQSANDEDKVNATLGCARRYHPSDIADDFADNIGETVEAMYTWVSSLSLQRYSHLQQLSLVGDANQRKLKHLPSWVVDLSVGFVGDPMTTIAYFDATCVKKSSSPPPEIRGRELLVQGFQIGVIEAAHGTWKDFSVAESCLVHLSHLLPEYQATGQSSLEAMWRTLILDSYGEVSTEFKRPMHKGIGTVFREWIELTLAIEYTNPQLRSIDSDNWWGVVRSAISGLDHQDEACPLAEVIEAADEGRTIQNPAACAQNEQSPQAGHPSHSPDLEDHTDRCLASRKRHTSSSPTPGGKTTPFLSSHQITGPCTPTGQTYHRGGATAYHQVYQVEVPAPAKDLSNSAEENEQIAGELPTPRTHPAQV